jgi:cytochrome P450
MNDTDSELGDSWLDDDWVDNGNQASSIAKIVFDLNNISFINDPYPILNELRENAPRHLSNMGALVLTQYHDIVKLLADTRLGNAPSSYSFVHANNRNRYVCADVANNILPFLDPPEHTRLRSLISKVYHPHLREYHPDVTGIANALVDELEKKGDFDVQHDFGKPLAIRVICKLIGIESVEEEQLKEWSEWFFYLFVPFSSDELRVKVDEYLDGFRRFLGAVLQKRKTAPANDLISKLVQIETDEGKLSDAEIIDNCLLLIADAIENIDTGIANALATLLQHPDQLELLRSRMELMPYAVNECLRFQSPNLFIGRVAHEDFHLGETLIRKNQAVLLMLAAANRDPDVFENPDVFDIQRDPNPHIAFGKSRHACIGRALTKLQIEGGLTVLLSRLKNIDLRDPKLRWIERLGHRWLEGLPIKFEC